MDINNVSLWFAKNKDNEIITIDKINKEDKYICPLCGSEVIGKALESDKMSPHFAHIDRSKCSGESIIHYWVKNELIKKDDVIEIITNESRQHMIKEIAFEQSYDTPYGVYKPDITLITYKDEMVFVEVNYTNKKDTKDYYLKWNHLKNTVLEFSIKNVYSDDGTKVVLSNSFKAIYYDGMEFDESDREYGSYKDSISSKALEGDLEKLNDIRWFLNDVYRYNMGINNDIEELSNSFTMLSEDKNNRGVLESIYRNTKCKGVIKEIIEYKNEKIKCVAEKIKEKYGYEKVFVSNNLNERLIKDKLFKDGEVKISKEFIYDKCFSKSLPKKDLTIEYNCSCISIKSSYPNDNFYNLCCSTIDEFYKSNIEILRSMSTFIKGIYKAVKNMIDDKYERVLFTIKVMGEEVIVSYYILDVSSGHICYLDKSKIELNLDLNEILTFIKTKYNSREYKKELEDKKHIEYISKRYIEVSELSENIYNNMNKRYSNIGLKIEYDKTNSYRYFTKIIIPSYNLYIFFNESCADICVMYEDIGRYMGKTKSGYRWRAGLVNKFKTILSIDYKDGFESILYDEICNQIRSFIYGGNN